MISTDTPILPDIVADMVVGELEHILGSPLKSAYASRLIERAERVYANNEPFKRRIRSRANHGNAGRDWLYVFMRHWLAAEVVKDSPRLRSKIPPPFFLGLPVSRA